MVCVLLTMDMLASCAQIIMFRFLLLALFVAFSAAFSGPMAISQVTRSQVTMAAKKKTEEKSTGGFWANVRPESF